MKGKELEKELKSRLFGYFEKNNFAYNHWYENTYFKKDLQQFQIILEIQSKSQSIGGFTELGLTIWGVEEIIKEIGFLNIDSDILDKWYPYTKTLTDNNFSKQLVRNHEGLIANLEEIELYCQSIIDYMETESKAFVEKYSYLPNILKEMEQNTKDGVYWSYGVFNGIEASFFKGLIISKLCNDPKFEEKIKYVDWVYYPIEHNLQAFIPYYEKLKERLASVEPIYNI